MEGSDNFYLYVRNGGISWAVYSSLKREKVFVKSGSASHPCPAHPSNAPNDWQGTKEWRFNAAEDKSVQNADLKESGVVISCSVHSK